MSCCLHSAQALSGKILTGLSPNCARGCANYQSAQEITGQCLVLWPEFFFLPGIDRALGITKSLGSFNCSKAEAKFEKLHMLETSLSSKKCLSLHPVLQLLGLTQKYLLYNSVCELMKSSTRAFILQYF